MKFLSFLLIIILFNCSCSTILFTSKEKIKVSSNLQGVDLELNGKIIGKNVDSSYFITLSKRVKKQELKISKPGYDSQSFIFKRSSRSGAKTFDIVGTITGGGLLITGLALLPNPIPEEAAKAGPVLIAGAALFVPVLIDLISKSSNTFVHKSLSFDLTPSTHVVTEKNSESILCSSINIKILPGTIIGSSFFQKKGKFVKSGSYKWAETSNISVEDLTVLVNNEFSNAGYSVPGLKNKFKENDNHSRFVIQAEIKTLEANVYNKWVGYFISPDINLKGQIIWSVYDNKKKVIVLENAINTSVWGNDQSMRMLIFNLVTNSIKKLISSQNFIDVTTKISKTVAKSVEIKTNEEKIIINRVQKPEKVSDLIESALTIDLGDGHGSGVIISNNGYVLTNAHVVGEEKSVSVILNSGLNLTADVIKVDETTDLALLKLPGKGYRSASISSNEISTGTDVIAIGTPGKIDLGQSISKGIISGKREIEGNIFIQTDVSISPGNSGGPLFTSDKELIGIICSKLIGKGIEGVGFAIPIMIALKKLGIEIK